MSPRAILSISTFISIKFFVTALQACLGPLEKSRSLGKPRYRSNSPRFSLPANSLTTHQLASEPNVSMVGKQEIENQADNFRLARYPPKNRTDTHSECNWCYQQLAERVAEKESRSKERPIPHFVRLLLADDVVGPFHQGNIDRNRTPLCVPTAQVCLRDPTGPGASSSRKHRDAFVYDLRHRLAQRRPSDGLDHINGCLAHKIGSVVGEKYLHLMAGLGQCDPMGKHEGCTGWLIVPQELLIKMCSFFFGAAGG